MLICSLMFCVMLAACSKKDASSDNKSDKSETTEQAFNAKKVVEKINNGENLTDAEFIGAVQFYKDAVDARDKAMQEENPDIEALQKKYEGIETIAQYVDNEKNWIGYNNETLEKAAKIIGLSSSQLKGLLVSGDDSETYEEYDEVDFDGDAIEVTDAEVDEYDF